MAENGTDTTIATPELRAAMADFARMPREHLSAFAGQVSEVAGQADLVFRAGTRHAGTISESHQARGKATIARLQDTAAVFGETGPEVPLHQSFLEYLRDAGERMILTVDALRERGDIFVAHEAAGCPPVLVYDYEIVLDGAGLERPCNYQLLRILPPEGVEVDEDRRPYIIVDPRAGHGGGIGGFKTDSQVGVALKERHPVYFVSFRRMPERGQTLADVCNAEAEFVREVIRRHPDSPLPVVTGNCQGGWAALIMAATNPDITGPICLNGSPVATWSGEVGKNPMRYNGGILGGTWQPMFWSDLGGGVFDGAHLVMNFEQLNPSRNYFRKYYDLYASVDNGKQRFLEFERWWGGFFCLNEPEIRWIVEQLFVGNRVVKNTAQLEPGRPIDVKKIKAPIIVFTSHGDNITPPQQALNWIVDSYADVEEIRIRGQRILYMVHPEVGHLGIFVSSKIAQKEHSQVASTMETIEALPPGLYEMQIDSVDQVDGKREYLVSFHERELDDIRRLDDGRDDEVSFGAVSRASEMQAEFYDVFVRPWVRAMVSPPMADTVRALHPLRLQRSMMSSMNPMMKGVEQVAGAVKGSRTPVSGENPFVRAERIAADMVEQSLDLARDMRDAMYEMTFFGIWGGPWAQRFGRPNALRRALKKPAELRALPEVEQALLHIARGGFVEAVIRMLVLLAESRGNVRRDRLERSSRVLTLDEPFRSVGMEQRARVIHEQTLIATFAPERAVETLPMLLPSEEERRLAVEVAQYVPGPIAEMAPHTLATLQRFREVLGLPPVGEDILEDPLANPGVAPSAGPLGTAAE